MIRPISSSLAGILLACSSVAMVGLAVEDSKKATLIQALETMVKKDISLVGHVSEAETPDNESGPFGKMQAMATRTAQSVMNQSGDIGWTGDFEVMVSANKEIAFLSEKSLPEIKFYSTPSQSLYTQTFAGQPPNVSQLDFLVSRLVDWKQIADGLGEAKKLRETTQDNTTVLKVVLDSELLALPSLTAVIQANMFQPNQAKKTMAASMNPLSPAVIDYAVDFRLDEQGKLQGMVVNLQLDDPLKEVMKRSQQGVAVPPRLMRQGRATKEEKEAAELGKLLTFEFEVKEKPSEQLLLYVQEAKSRLPK